MNGVLTKYPIVGCWMRVGLGSRKSGHEQIWDLNKFRARDFRPRAFLLHEIEFYQK